MRNFFSVTVWTSLLTIFKMAVGFIITKIIALYGGPSSLALLGQFQNLITSLNGLVNAPVGNGIIRYTAELQDKDERDCYPLWRAGVKWCILIYIFILGLGLLFSHEIAEYFLKNREYSIVIVVSLFLLPFTALGTLINSIVNGRKEFKLYVFIGMISTLITCCTMVGLILYDHIYGALFSVALQYAVIGLTSFIIVFKKPWFRLNNFFGKVKKQELRKIGAYIVMAVTSAVALPFSLMLIRNFMIAHVGWDVTGQWQAVWRISEVYLSVLTLALGVYYLPRLASLSDAVKIINEVNGITKLVLPLVILMGCIVFLCRDFVITLLFSKEFLPARDYFVIQLVGDCLKILNWIYSYPMLSRGNVKWFVSLEIFFAFLFYVLTVSLMMFASLGVESVLYAYVINQAVCFIFLKLMLRKYI